MKKLLVSTGKKGETETDIEKRKGFDNQRLET